MFLGHVAVGLAAKKVAPRTSLLWLVAAPTLLDLLWPVFLVLGLEEVRIAPGITAVTPLDFVSYPWSHSLVMTLVWSSLAAACYLAATGYAAGALAIAIGVTSHWVLDWVSHRPDLPLAPWSDAKVGLGLWNSVPATLLVEGALFAGGVWLYARATKARDAVGHWSFAVFVALLAVIYVGNVFGPPPPSVHALKIVAFAGFLIPAWAAWFDGHRSLRSPD
jgi:membrane-bound metal-dependent hydrolase YbcI (DUF457 family)